MNELRQLLLKLPDDTVLALNGYFEARGEYKTVGEAAYAAVMAVVLNRVESLDWPNSLQEVVAQPRQFSWTTHDDAVQDPQYAIALKFARQPEQAWDRLWLAAKDVAQRLLSGAVYNPVKNATFYFNPESCRPSWAKYLRLIRDLGHHRFMADPGEPEVLWPGRRQEDMMEERPADCPYPEGCTPLFVRSRLCYGRMAQLKIDPDVEKYDGDARNPIKNSHRCCLDGEEDAQLNKADAYYEMRGLAEVLLDGQVSYNPLPAQGIDDAADRLSRRLQGVGR
ncbi:MAG: cell wall hydrolase [Deltaproteobacteria bacterium]|nr:cell wall hydrolase [Deltaproteobacteria bacterium]